MAFSGMDVGEVEHLAAQLELEVNAINAVVSVIDRGVSALAGVWMGDDVAVFSGLWQQSHRPRAQSVADSLSTWVTQLREQARDQVHTSGGRGHQGAHHPGWLDSMLGAAGDALHHLATAVEDSWKAIDDVIGTPKDVFGAISSAFAGGAYLTTHSLVGSYPKGWNGLPDFLHWKKSESIQWLDRFIGSHPGLAHGLTQNAGWIDSVDKSLSFLGYAGMGVSAVQALDYLNRGKYLDAGLEGASLAADGLKQSKSPVAYLGGMAVESWVQVFKEAKETDWSAEGFQTTWDYMVKDPWGALCGAGEGLKEMPGILLEIGA